MKREMLCRHWKEDFRVARKSLNFVPALNGELLRNRKGKMFKFLTRLHRHPGANGNCRDRLQKKLPLRFRPQYKSRRLRRHLCELRPKKYLLLRVRLLLHHRHPLRLRLRRPPQWAILLEV